MTSKNDITGDWIKSKPNSQQFDENFDGIFRKKNFKCNGFCGYYECLEHQAECIKGKESVSRIEQIGQNGNDGAHYEYELDKSTGEVIKKNENT